MTRGHGRTFVNKVGDGRSYTMSSRSSEQSGRRFPSKESQMIVPVSRSCEERRIILTFLTLDDHLLRLLVPFTSFIQGPELKNQQASQDPVNADRLDNLNSSYPQPAIFIQFDLKEQSLSSQENPAFSSASMKTVTEYRSSTSGKPHKLKRNMLMKNTPRNSLATGAPEESSRLSYGSDCIAFSPSVDVTGTMDKSVKPSSRNKGKKKRKQSKRSMRKKVSTKPENQGGVRCDASESDTSASGDLVCMSASESNLSLLPYPNLPVHDAAVELKDQLNIEYVGKECSSILSISVGEPMEKNINDPKKQLSLPYEFSDNTDKVSIEVVASISNQSYESSLSTSFQNNPEIVMSEDSPVDCRTLCSIANDCGFGTLENRMTLNSRNVPVQDENKVYSHKDNDLSSSCSVNCAHWQNDAIVTDCSTERLLDSSQASCSDDFHPVIRAKRGRLARKLSGSSNGMHGPNNTHSHRCSEKDYQHSIWQKVEKFRTSKSTFPRNNDKIASRDVDISLNCMKTKVKSKQLTELKQDKNGKTFSTMDSSRTTCTYPEKLYRKPNLATERVKLSECGASINNVNVPSKVTVIRKEELETEQTDKTNSMLGNINNSQSSILQQITKANKISNILPNTSSLPREILANSSMEDIQCMRVEIESAHLESSRTNQSFGPLLQKCLPPPRHDVVITSSEIVNQADSIEYEAVPGRLISTFTDEFLNSNSHGLDSLSTIEMQCLSPTSGYMDYSSYEENELIRKNDNQPCPSLEESCDFPSPSSCHLSHEMGNQLFPCFETDLTKISEAADGSYRLFVAAEGIQQATGSTLAEFEKVLHSASPLIETDCFDMCNICFKNQIIGDSLSSLQVPNISLKSLWQWYEKPGSYGLEVKVDDLYSNRSRTGLSKFCAYFVPYLSAVQLFAQSGSPSHHPNNEIEEGLVGTCEACKTSKSITSLASLPIFSKLLPQPHKKDKGLPSSGKREEFNSSICSKQIADELIFEYFDSDQPQHRRPLFNMIQEMIRGDSLSSCHFFGDPSKLGSLKLKELHPASWYAVAWYPIYRIPDGSFRAAFLTYHSFGHFVSRSSSSTTKGCITSVLSPVVGLQSYNAQGECWFEPKILNFEADASSSESPLEILKGRLQSLERTACTMSRATVRKGNLESTNRHPDYEFFVSRRR
ncbi:hypothetical protein KSP40_PGU016387 [Platanthera guangdongensis]|uniref:Uncharacterized protein n=1 Tax=Platanthera guangdongensis TaxID=2320717 RepID=A0ABR2MYA2_9ASPA